MFCNEKDLRMKFQQVLLFYFASFSSSLNLHLLLSSILPHLSSSFFLLFSSSSSCSFPSTLSPLLLLLYLSLYHIISYLSFSSASSSFPFFHFRFHSFYSFSLPPLLLPFLISFWILIAENVLPSAPLNQLEHISTFSA